MPTNPPFRDAAWYESYELAIVLDKLPPAEPEPESPCAPRSIKDRLRGALRWLVQLNIDACAAYAMSMYPPIIDLEQLDDPSAHWNATRSRQQIFEPEVLARRPSSDAGWVPHPGHAHRDGLPLSELEDG